MEIMWRWADVGYTMTGVLTPFTVHNHIQAHPYVFIKRTYKCKNITYEIRKELTKWTLYIIKLTGSVREGKISRDWK